MSTNRTHHGHGQKKSTPRKHDRQVIMREKGRECMLVLIGHSLTLLRRWMERSMRSEPATRRVSTVATDHVGVSASDRISPSPPAISPPAGAGSSSPLLPSSYSSRPTDRTSAYHIEASAMVGRAEVALGEGKLSLRIKTKAQAETKTRPRPRRCGNAEVAAVSGTGGGVTPSPSVGQEGGGGWKREGKWGILEKDGLGGAQKRDVSPSLRFSRSISV